MLTATIPGHRGDQTVSVIITATDTTDHLSTHVSTEIYITGNLGINAMPADGGLEAQQTEQVDQTELATTPNVHAY